MGVVVVFISILYGICLMVIALFSLMQFHLLLHYLFHRKEISKSLVQKDTNWPEVTVQLPVYNEPNVIGRLLDTIVKLDYPRERLFIQILDDSTDKTSDIVHQKRLHYMEQGFQIEHIRRQDRAGFKAGALQHAMPMVHTPLVAIFDADFLPESDFLKVSVPYFKDEHVAVVQGRWTHLNKSYSLLTQMQAFQLDVHFTVEQAGRYVAGCFLQFNGTAGIWRKAAIEASGGWSSETLTEDLELSYRAQMKGWKIIFLEDLRVPAELPASMQGLRSQQFRWMKGGAETARKMLPVIWRSDIPLIKKCHATVHLCSSSVFIAILLMGICSIILPFYPSTALYMADLFPYFTGSTIILLLVYMTAYRKVGSVNHSAITDILYFMLLFPVFLATSMAMSLHNSKATLEGWIGIRSPFVRTPKAGYADKGSKKGASNFRKPDFQTLAEFIFFCIFFAAALFSYMEGVFYLLIIQVLFALGFATLVYFGICKDDIEQNL